MMSELLTKILLNFGLSEKEATVYLVSLQIGPAPVLKISRLSGLKRPTVYLIVDSLIKKGLIRVNVKGFKNEYAAEDPERLEIIANEKKNELMKNLPLFQEIFQKDKNTTFMRYYEGIDAIKLLYGDILKEIRSGDDYLVIGNQEEWFSKDPAFFQKFIEKRAKLDLRLQLLFQDSPIAREHKKFQRNYNEQVKILPKATSLATNLVILPQKVIIHELAEPSLAIVIENQNVVRMNREMFEIIWNSIE